MFANVKVTVIKAQLGCVKGCEGTLYSWTCVAALGKKEGRRTIRLKPEWSALVSSLVSKSATGRLGSLVTAFGL